MHPWPKFNKMNRHFYLIMLFLSLVGFRSSDQRHISGTVYDVDNRQPLAGVAIMVKGGNQRAYTDSLGRYSIQVGGNSSRLVFSFIGYKQQYVKIGKSNTIDVWLKPDHVVLEEVVVTDQAKPHRKMANAAAVSSTAYMGQPLAGRVGGIVIAGDRERYSSHTESYKGIAENTFHDPRQEPLSTFAVDVDAASYSNFRRFIHSGTLPPKDAVRLEEMINYFQYDVKGPDNGDPVAIHTELSSAPWNAQHRLLRIALKAKSVDTDKLPASNLVFLLDVSGSMSGHNRLPLVKASMHMLVDQLRDVDQVSIVTYAGTASIKLDSTPGHQKTTIKNAIDELEAGGATAGGAGIKQAYRLAKENFIKGGNNRIVLASDGDFNVGASSDEDMERLVANERQSGISLSVLGFGMGNYKDSKMETLANKGHGNYAYIDNVLEAKKAMVTEFGGTFFTVAKDVKVQVEFNPGKVRAYRLLGYENRLLEKEDFNNDHKLGGDMGVGHSVTAMYEIVPVGVKDSFVGSVDPLKYQQVEGDVTTNKSPELATIKFRYKQPDGEKSAMQQSSLRDEPKPLDRTSDDFRFASAVAELGLLVRQSEYRQQADFDRLISRAKAAKGKDDEGYRAEFVRLAESAKLLSKDKEFAQQ